jgi:hypothetical protein
MAMAQFEYYLGICLMGLRKPMINSNHDSMIGVPHET